jgi:predicted phosphoribosyltransferase
MAIIFPGRREAGRQLAGKLAHYAERDDVTVLALPRGGVPVGYEVARVLGAPLDVFVVRKLGLPGYEELAMGAIATSGVRVLNKEIVDDLAVPAHVIDAVTDKEEKELLRASDSTAVDGRRSGWRGELSSSWTTGSPRDPPYVRRSRRSGY